MNEREAFVRAILANPADDTPRLVMADWFDDQGESWQAAALRRPGWYELPAVIAPVHVELRRPVLQWVSRGVRVTLGRLEGLKMPQCDGYSEYYPDKARWYAAYHTYYARWFRLGVWQCGYCYMVERSRRRAARKKAAREAFADGLLLRLAAATGNRWLLPPGYQSRPPVGGPVADQ